VFDALVNVLSEFFLIIYDRLTVFCLIADVYCFFDEESNAKKLNVEANLMWQNKKSYYNRAVHEIVASTIEL